MADRPAAAEQETAAAGLGPTTAAGGPHAARAAADLCKKLCAFCGGDAGAFGCNLGRMQGPFFTSSKGHDAPIYVHHECALWSPQITVDAWNRLQSVVREVRRARNLRCSICDRPGAALGCRVPSCPRCFHLPCAIEHGCWFNFELYLMSCQEHSALFKKEPAGRQGRAVAGPLKHLKLSSRHLLSGLPKVFAGSEAAAAAAAVLGNSRAGDGRRRAHAASGSKRRNRMSAEELGGHIAAAEEAYLGLVDELRRGEESEDDDAVFARKNAKRFRKAEELLAPTFLEPPAAKQPRQQPQQHAQAPLAASAQQALPPEAQERYRQHIQQAHLQHQQQQPKKLVRQQPQQQPQQQQQGVGWQPSSEGFKGVGGLNDAKRQLREMVLMPLTYPDLYKSLGIHPPRGILLHGPPGTGKTALVRALAAECAALSAQPSVGDSSGSMAAPKPVALFARKGTDCLGKYAGDAELHLRMLFEMAAASAPSIIFLDELDGLVPARSVRSGGSDQIFASIVSVLLALMDGLTDRGQVLVIGATNRPDNIDPALRRPGRFDREVFVGLPGAQHRTDILALHTAKWNPPPTRQQLELIAAQTEGWAGADLQSLAASALLAAVRRITPQLLDSMGKQQRQQQQQQKGTGKAAESSEAAAAAAAALATGITAGLHADTEGHAAAADPGMGGNLQAAGTTAATAKTTTSHQPAQQAHGQVAAGSYEVQMPAAAVTGGVQGPAAAAAASDGGGGGGHASPAAAAAAAVGSSPDAPARRGGFLAALHEFVTVKPGSGGFLFSPPRTTPPLESDDQHKTQGNKQQLIATAQEQQQQPAEHHHLPVPSSAQQQPQQQEQQQQQRQQQQQPTPSAIMVQQVQQQQQQQQRLSPGPASGLPPRAPRPRSGSRTKSPAARTTLPAALQALQVLACDWSTALAELGPPASKRGSHNLPAISPAAALPAPLAPLLLPALTSVVDVLQGWLLLAAQDHTDWQQAKAGHADHAGIADVARAGDRGGGAAQDAGGGDGVSQTAGADLLTAWEAVLGLPSAAAATVAAAAGVEDAHACRGTSGMGVSDPPHAPPALQQQVLGGLFGGSNLLGAGGTRHLQHGSSSSTPHCLLLSGHGPEGQSEVAAATLKLLEGRAGACVYMLSLPVMLLLGEGSASAGLVSGVQEALGRTSSTQPLVIYLPRLELWALEAAKPVKDAARAAAAAAAACGQTRPQGRHLPQHTLGGWCSGLRGAFSSSTDSSSDEEDMADEADDGYDSDGNEAAVGQHQQQQWRQRDANNINNCNEGLGQAGVQQGQHGGRHSHAHHQRQLRQQGEQQQNSDQVEGEGARLQFSAAWSVFEQQLAMLHSQRQLLILATTQLPVQELPFEMQQLFGWQQQRQQQQVGISAAGVDAGLELQLSCSNSRTVQLCECAGLRGSSSAAASTGAVRAALEEALDRAVQLAAAALEGSSSSSDAGGPHNAQPENNNSNSQQRGITNGSDIGVAGSSSVQQQPVAAAGSIQQQQQQQQPVDALIAAALHQKDQQERQRQRQLPARVPTQQMLAAQQLAEPLKQLNDAQRAEAQTLLQQVQASLRHIASTVVRDPRLQLTHTRQQGSTQAGSSTSMLPAPSASNQGQQQQQQQMLSAAAQMAPGAVRKLEGCMPVAAVCVKALQGWYWGLDAFQTDFEAAAQSPRPGNQPTAASKRLCRSAAAATLADMVAAACHEARQRLRLYDHSRQQLLEAAALAKLSVQQQQELQVQQRHTVQEQQRQAGRGPKQRLSAQGAAQRQALGDMQHSQQQRQQQQQPIGQQNEAAVRQDGVGNTLLPSNHVPAAQTEGPVQLQSGASYASLAQNSAAQQRVVERLRAEAALVVADTFDSNGDGQNSVCCPAAGAFAAFERFWRTLNLAALAQPTMPL